MGDSREASGPHTSASPPSGPDRDAADEDFLFHLYRGSELLQDERLHEAKGELERALSYRPRDARGQDLLAVVYFRLGLYPRAREIYEALRDKNPVEPSVRLNLALCFLKLGPVERARDELEALVHAHPEHKRAWGYLGLCYERLGDATRAREAFERGGHALMAKRVTERGRSAPVLPSDASHAGQAHSSTTAGVFQELDAGELSPPLAAPEASVAPPHLPHPHHLPETGPAFVPGIPTPRVPPPPAVVIPRAADLAHAARVPFPASPGVTLHGSLALVTTSLDRPFAARLEALRTYTGHVTATILVRQTRDKAAGEPLGGVSAPLVHITGTSQIALAPRPGHALAAVHVDGDPIAFVREDRLLGFELSLAYESGRLGGEGDAMTVVQMRGTGVVLLELMGALGAIPVDAARSVTVRHEAVVGWLGRLVPRALSAAEAPCSQRGLVSFAGDGAVLVAS